MSASRPPGSLGIHRRDRVPGEEGIDLHNGVFGQVGDLPPVGDVDIGHKVSQAQQRLYQQVPLFTGPSSQELTSIQQRFAFLYTRRQIRFPPIGRGSAEPPAEGGLRVFFRYQGGMNSARCRITCGHLSGHNAGKVELHPVGTLKLVIHPVVVLAFQKASRKILIRKTPVQGNRSVCP